MATYYMRIESGEGEPGFTITNTGGKEITITTLDPGAYAVIGTWYIPDGKVCPKRKSVYKYQLMGVMGK